MVVTLSRANALDDVLKLSCLSNEDVHVLDRSLDAEINTHQPIVGTGNLRRNPSLTWFLHLVIVIALLPSGWKIFIKVTT